MVFHFVINSILFFFFFFFNLNVYDFLYDLTTNVGFNEKFKEKRTQSILKLFDVNNLRINYFNNFEI